MEKVKEITQKAKDAISGGHHNDPHPTTQPSTHEGPHSSGLANQADPRVDSDRDGSRNVGMTGGTHGHSTTTGTYGTDHSSAHPTTQPSTHVGPHSSGLANQADPRVDSDRDASNNMGLQGGVGHSTHGTGQASTTAGPHSSNLANKLDPRVDSDLDGSRNMGMASSGPTGQTGYSGTTSGIADHQTHNRHPGPHSSGLANQADPRVDSDLDGSRNAGFNSGNTGYNTGTTSYNTGTTGTTGGVGEFGQTTGHGTAHATAHTGTHNQAHAAGQAQNTAGPHNSDMLNKLDPRVDSDLDGSRNMGMSRNANVADASKHTPSEFAKIGGHGDPEVGHSGDPADHRRRHSLNEVDTANTLDRYGSGQ